MPTNRTSSRVWEDAAPSVAEPLQLLFVTIGVVDAERSFLDLSLRAYLELKDEVTRALGGADHVTVTASSHEITISARGGNADDLWERCALILEVPALRDSVTVLRRYGGPGARELVTRL